MKRSILPAFLLCASCPQLHAADAAEVKIERIRALAKTYFRDSAEIPMDVAVTTVVTDKAGKPKRKAQSSVRMIFNGYNQQSGKFSLHANSGMFNTWALRDSMSGDLAAFFVALFLAPHKDNTPDLELRQPSQPGEPILVTNHPETCAAFVLMPPGRFLFPGKPCGAAQFSLAVKPPNDLMFQHYSFESAGLPAAAKVQYLGDVRILAFHTDVDFQEGSLPGDATPYLWPKQTIVLVTTDRGKISITNKYSPKLPVKH